MVNHVYRSLPQTPLTASGRCVSARPVEQREVLLGDARRRSCCDAGPQRRHEAPGCKDHADRSPRFKFPPLVTSKSSENFHQLRRVALATVLLTFDFDSIN